MVCGPVCCWRLLRPAGPPSRSQDAPALASPTGQPSELPTGVPISPAIPKVGVREPLASLADEFRFNGSFVDRVRQLREEHRYGEWRRVRGDGNCFYRCLAFALLEQLVLLGAAVASFGWATRFFARLSAVSIQDPLAQPAHNAVLKNMERLLSGAGWPVELHAAEDATPMSLLYRGFRDPCDGSDIAIIGAVRCFVADYLQGHAGDEEACGGISFACLCMAQGYTGIDEFNRKVVLPLGKGAETLVLPAVAKALDIGLHVAFLDRTDPLTFQHFKGDTSEGTPEVHVQLRPGHYDLLYPASEMTQLPTASMFIDGIDVGVDHARRVGRPPTLSMGDPYEWTIQVRHDQ